MTVIKKDTIFLLSFGEHKNRFTGPLFEALKDIDLDALKKDCSNHYGIISYFSSDNDYHTYLVDWIEQNGYGKRLPFIELNQYKDWQPKRIVFATFEYCE